MKQKAFMGTIVLTLVVGVVAASAEASPLRFLTFNIWGECAGMMTFDREVVKFDYGFLCALHKEILDAAREGAEGR